MKELEHFEKDLLRQWISGQAVEQAHLDLNLRPLARAVNDEVRDFRFALGEQDGRFVGTHQRGRRTTGSTAPT